MIDGTVGCLHWVGKNTENILALPLSAFPRGTLHKNDVHSSGQVFDPHMSFSDLIIVFASRTIHEVSKKNKTKQNVSKVVFEEGSKCKFPNFLTRSSVLCCILKVKNILAIDFHRIGGAFRWSVYCVERWIFSVVFRWLKFNTRAGVRFKVSTFWHWFGVFVACSGSHKIMKRQ